jgi:hypothetical protein
VFAISHIEPIDGGSHRLELGRSSKVRFESGTISLPPCAHRSRSNHQIRVSVAMSTILLIILVLLVVGALPTWPYSAGWGYYPSSGLGVVLIILLVLVLLGRV